MHYGLPCEGTIVNPDIEPFGLPLPEQESAHFGQQVYHGHLLFPGRFEKRNDVTFGDNQGMASADGRAVIDRLGVLVRGDDVGQIQLAKGTIVHGFNYCPKITL